MNSGESEAIQLHDLGVYRFNSTMLLCVHEFLKDLSWLSIPNKIIKDFALGKASN